jgi:hypothetical protein
MKSAAKERREDIMAFSKEHRRIAELKNIERHHGFMDVDGATIQECAEFIMTPVENEETRQNAKNISSTFGNVIAWLINVSSAKKEISGVNEKQLLSLYLCLAQAPYNGSEMKYTLHTFDKDNPIDQKMMKDLRKLKLDEEDTGMEKEPDRVLQVSVDGEVLAMYFPKWKCFVPGVRFPQSEKCCKVPEEFMAGNPHITKRCRALLTNLIAKGANAKVLGKVLDYIGGALTDAEMELYRAEPAETLPEEVIKYIQETSAKADPLAVCNYMGSSVSEKVLRQPVLINTGTRCLSDINDTFGEISDRLIVIPPVQNVRSIKEAGYKFARETVNGIPKWIEFRARLDGELCHKIYAAGKSGFRICQPDNYIDMAYMVPEGILAKYNYLVQGSAAGAITNDNLETRWNVFPEDPGSSVIRLTSNQYDGDWEIHQRSLRIERMELCDREGNVLGTIVMPKILTPERKNQKMYLSLDPAGATSVRLKSIEGSGKSEAISYENLTFPLTPTATTEFNQTLERRLMDSGESGTHFDSLLQQFFPETMGNWSALMVESRIWKPDEQVLFAALKDSPGTMTEAMTNIGVISNMKEILTRSNLKVRDRQLISMALKQYIGIMILEGILALAREGFSVPYNNLEFMISYPENGSGEGLTKQILDVIRGAISMVNEYLLPEAQLAEGGNITLCSESEAAAVWHQLNPPDRVYIGDAVALASLDIGYSTSDFSLRVNGRLYLSSVPYAAQRITNGSLARVYEDGNAAALLRCFSGGSQNLKNQAEDAIGKAMESKQGELYERLGFNLSLNRLFSECHFHVTGINADVFQMKVQELTEAKLNIGIPAYAHTIVRALKDGALHENSEILLGPVGKGSLALNNTALGFAERFASRLYEEINYLLHLDPAFEGTEYTGNIRLLTNNDTEKLSVAQGMIDMKEHVHERAEIIVSGEPTEHYLDVLYGSGVDADNEAKEQFREELARLTGKARRLERQAKQSELYKEAFKQLVSGYTYQKFEEAYERFGYTGIEDGIHDVGVLDNRIVRTVQRDFENLRAQLQQSEELVMSTPFVEEEMLCGAMIDLALKRISLLEES